MSNLTYTIDIVITINGAPAPPAQIDKILDLFSVPIDTTALAAAAAALAKETSKLDAVEKSQT